MTTTSQAIETLDHIQRELDASQRESLAPADLCKTYQKIKPALLLLLPLIDRFLGKTIGEAIRFLMKIADGLCPA